MASFFFSDPRKAKSALRLRLSTKNSPRNSTSAQIALHIKHQQTYVSVRGKFCVETDAFTKTGSKLSLLIMEQFVRKFGTASSLTQFS